MVKNRPYLDFFLLHYYNLKKKCYLQCKFYGYLLITNPCPVLSPRPVLRTDSPGIGFGPKLVPAQSWSRPLVPVETSGPVTVHIRESN